MELLNKMPIVDTKNLLLHRLDAFCTIPYFDLKQKNVDIILNNIKDEITNEIKKLENKLLFKMLHELDCIKCKNLNNFDSNFILTNNETFAKMYDVNVKNIIFNELCLNNEVFAFQDSLGILYEKLPLTIKEEPIVDRLAINYSAEKCIGIEINDKISRIELFGKNKFDVILM